MKKTKTSYEEKLVFSDNNGANKLLRIKKDWARPE